MSEDRLDDELPTSIFRPSYSATTLGCPGSFVQSLRVGDKAGIHAAIGTVFHQVIAEWQMTGERPDHLLGRVQKVDQFEVEIDDDMFVYGEECLVKYADIPGERHVETKVDISHLTPIKGQWGTADLYILQPGILDVIDWKYGKGVKVFAKDNTQELCYASGVFRKHDWEYNFHTIRLHIAQPRLGHYDVWEISREELLEFEESARRIWRDAWNNPSALRIPSPKACQWCKVRLRCPAKQAMLEALVDETFDLLDEVSVSPEAQQEVVRNEPANVSLTLPAELDTARLAWIYQYRKDVETWFREIGEELLRRGMGGDNLGGLWKVVRGRPGNRKWRDQDTAAEALLKLGVEDVYEYEVISPTEAEKRLRARGIRGRLGRDYVNLYTRRSDGRPTLVPVGENRSSLNQIVDDTFEVDDDL